MKKKFDFGALAPVAAKSDFEKKIDAEMEYYRVEKNNSPAFNASIKRPEKFKPQNEEEELLIRNEDNIEKGQKCEDDVKYALNHLPRDKFRVLYNTFIYGKNAAGEEEAQEHDAIIICNNIVFDIEAKSIAGDILTITPDGQWQVKNGRRVYSIPNPVAQTERHAQNLSSKLKKFDVSILELVVTNNDRLLIKDENGNLKYTLLKTDNLVNFIQEIAKNETLLSSKSALITQAILDGKRPKKYNR